MTNTHTGQSEISTTIKYLLKCGQQIEKDKSLSFKKDLVRLFRIQYPENEANYNALKSKYDRQKKITVSILLVLNK